MRIGVVADTHLLAAPTAGPGHPFRPRLTVAGQALPTALLAALSGVDLILHAGDVYDAATLDRLAAIAPVLCARGSEDGSLAGDDRVRDSHQVTVEGVRIGLLHALDYPIPAWRPLDLVQAREFGGPVDVLIFGDSHIPVIERVEGVLLINPGSPTLPYGRPGLGTIALLDISPEGPRAEIVHLFKF